MRLTDILTENRIKIPLEHTEKEQVIEELVDLIDSSTKLNNKGQILKAVLDREAVMSTGVGDEVAIPHGKSDGVQDILAALGIARTPIDFQSLDQKPVRLIWLLVGPQEKTGAHLKALSRISRLMHKQDFRQRLIATRAPNEAIDVIHSEEEKYFEK